MSKKYLALVAVLAVFVLGAVAVNALSYSGTVTIDCDYWSAAYQGTAILDRDNTGAGMEQISVYVTDGAGTMLNEHHYANVLGTYTGGIDSDYYDVPPQYNPIHVLIYSDAGNGFAQQLVVDEYGVCRGLPTVDGGTSETPSGVPNAGIPSGSVVGRLSVDTLAYYAPGSITTIQLRAGQTYWVIGVDASGAYYKIALAQNYLWLPVETMTPNPDAPWNNTPLPTRTVS